MSFNVKQELSNCISWISNWFENKSGGAKGIILGVSGGKDSTVAARLCVEAIGSDKVYGLIMPNHNQSDLEDAIRVCQSLNIKYSIVDIGDIYSTMFLSSPVDISKEAAINIAPRIRMSMLYAVGQTMGYRVCGTGNACERYVGYSTKWGDGASDFNPLANFTVSEVLQLGDELGIEHCLVHKAPADGLSGLTDEDNMGVTYEQIEKHIRREDLPQDIFAKISEMHYVSSHKVNEIPCYPRVYQC